MYIDSCIYIYLLVYIYWNTTNCIVLFCTYLYTNLSTPLNTSRSMCRNLLCRNSSYFRLPILSNIPCIISLILLPATLFTDALTHSRPSFPKVQFLLPLSNVSANLLNKLGDLNTYINDEVLTCVITLPVGSRENLGFLN